MPQQPATTSSNFDDDLRTVRDDFGKDLAEARDHVDAGQPVPHPVVKRLLEWLPTLGGGLGAIMGGAASTPETLGLGTIPGAIAGAAVGGGIGRAAENSLNTLVGNPSPAPTDVSGNLASVGRAAAVQGATQAVGSVAGPVLKMAAPYASRFAQGMMQSAVKPAAADTAKALIKGSDLPVVQTLLDEGINVTRGGIEKLNTLIGAKQAEVKAAVSSIGKVIDPIKVATRADPVIAQAANQVDPAADVAAATAVKQRFLAQPGTQEFMTGPATQDMKIGTYRAVGNKAYGELKGAEVETQKALARGLKEELESEAAKQGINIGPANASEGRMMEARDAIAERIAKAGNRDLVSIGWIAHNPMLAAAFVAERSPAVKSMIARGMYAGAAKAASMNLGVTVTPQVMRLIVASIASSSEDQP